MATCLQVERDSTFSRIIIYIKWKSKGDSKNRVITLSMRW